MIFSLVEDQAVIANHVAMRSFPCVQDIDDILDLER
jgi:hypothetical protein